MKHDNNKRAEGKVLCSACHYFVPKKNFCKIRFETKDKNGRPLLADDRTPAKRMPYFVACNKFEPLEIS